MYSFEINTVWKMRRECCRNTKSKVHFNDRYAWVEETQTYKMVVNNIILRVLIKITAPPAPIENYVTKKSASRKRINTTGTVSITYKS